MHWIGQDSHISKVTRRKTEDKLWMLIINYLFLMLYNDQAHTLITGINSAGLIFILSATLFSSKGELTEFNTAAGG